jgi:hypothetical protein
VPDKKKSIHAAKAGKNTCSAVAAGSARPAFYDMGRHYKYVEKSSTDRVLPTVLLLLSDHRREVLSAKSP